MAAAEPIVNQLETASFSTFDQDVDIGNLKYAQDLKMSMFTLPATTDDTDYFTVDLWKQCGMKRMLGILGFQQATTDSIITTEDPTTVVSNGVATITVGGSDDDKKRTFIIIGV